VAPASARACHRLGSREGRAGRGWSANFFGLNRSRACDEPFEASRDLRELRRVVLAGCPSETLDIAQAERRDDSID
jgi:hypothetical protein